VVNREGLRGAVLLAYGELAGAEGLPVVPDCVQAAMRPVIERLQVPAASLPPDHVVYQWLAVAAAAESQGLFDESWDLLDALEDRVAESTLHDEPLRFRVASLVSARRGRVARMAGRHDDAEVWYAQAIRLARRCPAEDRWADGMPHALLGLAALASNRGNYPEARRLVQRVLAQSKVVHDCYLVPAHLIMQVICRKLGLMDEALRSVWEAHDLLTPPDARLPEVLNALGEVATEMNAPVPAVRARLAVLASAAAPRLAVGALAGVLSSLVRLPADLRGRCEAEIARSPWGRHVLSSRTEPTVSARLLGAARPWLDEADSRGLTPFDVVLLGLGLARMALLLGDRHYAAQVNALVLHTATQHGYHERVFESEALAAQIARPTPMPEPLYAPGLTESARSVSVRRLLKQEHPHAFDARAVFA
jgi:hypothetical protein